MIKTFKTEWFPSAKQREYVHKACGVRRWTWNWAVATFFEAAKQDKFPTSFDLQKQLNNSLVLEEGYEWLSEVNPMVRGEALKDFGLAIKAYAKARNVMNVRFVAYNVHICTRRIASMIFVRSSRRILSDLTVRSM